MIRIKNSKNPEPRTQNPEPVSGFTLIEMVIVVALMGIMIAVGSNIFVGVLRGNTKAAILTQVREDGTRAQELMSRAIQNASEVVNPSSGSDTVCDTRKFVIVRNRQVNTTQKQYTRYSWVNQPALNNDFLAVNHSDSQATLEGLQIVDAIADDLQKGAITNFNGKTSTHASAGCFRVQRSNNITLVTATFTLRQGQEATSLRKEFEATIDFTNTFTLRVY